MVITGIIALYAIWGSTAGSYQTRSGNEAKTIVIKKEDTILNILKKFKEATNTKVLIDGSVSEVPVGMEGEYEPTAFLSDLKKMVDYTYAVNGSDIVFFKKFDKEDTRPDYSIAELLYCLKVGKKALSGVISQKQQIAVTRLLDEVFNELPDVEKRKIESEQGVCIGELSANSKKKIVDAIYYKEFRIIYFELERLIEMLENLSGSTISRNTENTTISVDFEKNQEVRAFSLEDPKNIKFNDLRLNTKSQSLGEVLARNPKFSMDGADKDEVKNYKIVPVSDRGDVEISSVKWMSELNGWAFKTVTKDDSPYYSISSASNSRNSVNQNLATRLLSVMPVNVRRFMVQPLFPDEKMEDPMRLLYFSSGKVKVTKRASLISDQDILMLCKYLEKNSSDKKLKFKELPENMKESLVDILLMRAIYKIHGDIASNAFMPNSYILEPEKAFLRRTQEADGATAFTVKSPNGGMFAVRGRFIPRDKN